MAHSGSATDSAKPANYQRVLLGAIIFTGEFLLFQIQPVISKYMLPWFGGSSAVWATAMLLDIFGCKWGLAIGVINRRAGAPLDR